MVRRQRKSRRRRLLDHVNFFLKKNISQENKMLLVCAISLKKSNLMFHEPIETPDVQNNMFRLQNSLECLNGTPPPLDYASLECLEICRLGKAINAST